MGLLTENTIIEVSSEKKAKLLERAKTELSDDELLTILDYKKKYPDGLMGWKNVYKTAKSKLSTKK